MLGISSLKLCIFLCWVRCSTCIPLQMLLFEAFRIIHFNSFHAVMRRASELQKVKAASTMIGLFRTFDVCGTFYRIGWLYANNAGWMMIQQIRLLFYILIVPGEVNTSEMLVNMAAGSLEDFYPAIAIAILMRYIRDPSLSQHHRTVVQAITFIFKSLGSKCIPYLSQVVPAYLHVIRASEAIFREV